MAVLCRNLGRSLGLRAFGLEVWGGSGNPPRRGQRWLRILGWHLSVLPLGLGVWLSPQRPLHDRLAGTVVQMAPPPHEAKRRRALVSQWGLMALLLTGLTIWLGWLIIQVDLGLLIRRRAHGLTLWREMLRPDFTYFAVPDPVFELRRLPFSILDMAVITLFMALLATVLGALFAFPLSFLGARNIMGFNILGWMVYFVMRGLFNIFRSIETLLWAVIFAIWVIWGSPLAGVLALTVHTIAALGKLYSEQVEGIDPGPVEAVVAAGGSRLEVIRYAVIPQVAPSFWAFTMYRWDINVRMSTVIALVGGGGIGDLLFYYKNQGDWPKVGAVIMVIVAIVWAMDYISGRLRERIT
ncbi:MAG TPA: phosphonate ABC transporter, permease protein PhnE [Candidatus Acetothermia bacterium]|nr:phosphonate ABC transporter, permease protein PhnE [Candidatus Acetothermia bacterium]